MVKIKDILENEDNKLNDQKENIFKSFQVFKFIANRAKLDSLIIDEYKKKHFFKFLNDNINKKNFDDSIIYFSSRFIYTLNSYATTKQKYFNGDEIYLGKTLPYSSLLTIERKKGNIIFFSDFKIAARCKNTEEIRAKRFIPKINYQKDCCFSVIFTIQNNNKNFISNSIEINFNPNMEEIILLPFSFYHIKDIIIDYSKFTCDICLQNIGKIDILEEKIKLGKSIRYNNEKDIMEDV